MNEPASDGRAPSILIVEDDPQVRKALVDGFAFEGYEVHTCDHGGDCLAQVRRCDPQVILLDVMLPGLDGLEICERLRHDGIHTPIVMVTARGEAEDKIRGLRGGADDYVTKPFEFQELVARVEAVLRRSAPRREPSAVLCTAGFELDRATHRARQDGEDLDLTTLEFELLCYFVEHPHTTLSRDELLRRVWGHGHRPTTRTVDVHVAKLRKKIEADPANPRYILTLHGVGYRFLPEG